MKRLLSLVTMVGLLLTFSSGCLVGRHGHVAFLAPPELLVAGAIAVAAASRPGYLWVDGHWDWEGDRWQWSEGYWIAEQPGFIWIQGGWFESGGHHYYRPGRWDHRHR